LLKELRIEAGLTQEGLAHEASVERTYISLIEREQRQPSLRIFLALCKALKMAPADAIRMLEDRLKRGSR
jgi:DNA-binding XRE family transcriptional regulator